MTRAILSILIAATAASATATGSALPADSAATVMQRIDLSNRESQSLLSLAWQNPVINQYRHSYSLSSVAVSFASRQESTALRAQLGDGDRTWAFDATSYIKYKDQTLWGRAYYNNGRINNMTWNETSDVDIVYPYLLADSVGGKKMNVERYSFGGGYASHRGRLSWGAQVAYTAGLYYRNVDPRPRNVTAHLDLETGIGYRLGGNYVGALGIGFVKYKQTNNVDFYSELGAEKMFHLTGLANEYNRFGGTGYDTYYNGHQWGASLNLHATHNRGFSASVEAKRLTLNNVLTGLNKLPMAHVSHNAIAAEAGWLAAGWGIQAHMQASRRVGSENVFGDPMGGVYLKIGSLDMFYDNRFALGATGVWQHQWGGYGLAVRPGIDYNHHNVLYADPVSRLLYNDLTYALKLKGSATIGSTYHVLSARVGFTNPAKSQLQLSEPSAELMGLQRVIEREHNWLSKDRWQLSLGWATHVRLNDRYAIKASIDWQYDAYHNDIHSNQFYSSIAFLF